MKPNGQWWKRVIKLLMFLYVIALFLGQFYSIYITYTATRNPLLPRELSHAIAFPHFVLIIYWAVAIDIFWKFYNDTQNVKYRFLTVCLSFIAFLIGYSPLYQLLMHINPFTN